MDFSTLSNTELRQMLKDYGIDAGPINVATRRTYERKLTKLKSGQASPPSKKYEPVEDDEDDTEVQLRLPQATSTPSTTPGRGTPSSIPVSTQARSRREVLDQSYIPLVESRPGLQYRKLGSEGFTPRPAPALRKQTPQTPAPVVKATESGGIPLWVKLVALGVVGILVYLIFINMESQAVSNIPKIPNKVEV